MDHGVGLAQLPQWLRASDEAGRVAAGLAEPAIPPAYQPNHQPVKITKRDARIHSTTATENRDQVPPQLA